MTSDEVYLYTVPTLKTSSGHRAEDWNLANPIQTCKLLVERRGDSLALEFRHDEKLFAQATIDLTIRKEVQIHKWLESTVDSSRYFVVKIQGSGGREALVGFGFRDRDVATDLRESLQHYENSIRRQRKAEDFTMSTTNSYSIPMLMEGEKIHFDGKSGKSTITRKVKDKGNSVPILVRKPPPAATGHNPPAPKERGTTKEEQRL